MLPLMLPPSLLPVPLLPLRQVVRQVVEPALRSVEPRAVVSASVALRVARLAHFAQCPEPPAQSVVVAQLALLQLVAIG